MTVFLFRLGAAGVRRYPSKKRTRPPYSFSQYNKQPNASYLGISNSKTLSTTSSSVPKSATDDSNGPESSRHGNTAISTDTLRRLYDISKPERTLILASAGTLAITSSITLVLPYACGHVLDATILQASGASGSDGGAFQPHVVALGLFALTGTAGLGVWARSLMLNIAGNRIVSRMRRRLFASALAQESAFFDRTKAGDLLSRIANDAFFIKSAVTTEAVAGLRGVVMSVGSTSLLFYTSPSLAMVSLLSLPPVFLMARVVGRTLKEKQREVQKLHSAATDVAEEIFSSITTVQLFNAEQLERDRYAAAITGAHATEVDVGKTKAAFDGVVHVAANGAVLLVMGYGGTLVLDGQLSAGDLTGFLMYSLLMAGNVSSLSSTYSEIMKSVAAAGRVFEIIDRVPRIPSSLHVSEDRFDGKGVHTPFAGRERGSASISIKFDNVGFTYPARPNAPVLGPDFTLDIDAGEHVVLVGGSGSGKSTVR